MADTCYDSCSIDGTGRVYELAISFDDITIGVLDDPDGARFYVDKYIEKYETDEDSCEVPPNKDEVPPNKDEESDEEDDEDEDTLVSVLDVSLPEEERLRFATFLRKVADMLSHK